MNSLKGGSFPQIAISVCKLCRVAVESGRKSYEVIRTLGRSQKYSGKTKACRLHRPSWSDSPLSRVARGNRSVGVSKVSINYYYFNLVGLYFSEERARIHRLVIEFQVYFSMFDEGLARNYIFMTDDNLCSCESALSSRICEPLVGLLTKIYTYVLLLASYSHDSVITQSYSHDSSCFELIYLTDMISYP